MRAGWSEELPEERRRQVQQVGDDKDLSDAAPQSSPTVAKREHVLPALLQVDADHAAADHQEGRRDKAVEPIQEYEPDRFTITGREDGVEDVAFDHHEHRYAAQPVEGEQPGTW